MRAHARTGPLRIRRTLMLSIALLLPAACMPDNRPADLKRCVAKAERDFGHPLRQSTDQEYDAMGAEVVQCMKRLGYRHDMTSAKCDDDVDFTLWCYSRR